MFSPPFLQETNFLCGAESMVLQFGTFLIKNSSSNGILNQIKHNTLLLFSDAKPQNQQVKLELMFIYKHKGGGKSPIMCLNMWLCSKQQMERSASMRLTVICFGTCAPNTRCIDCSSWLV